MTLIYSRYATEEDWQELLHDLVHDLPKRLEAIDTAVAREDAEGLCFLVHQLKGACGSYGYDEVTVLASLLESVLRQHSDLSACEPELADFRDALRRMTDQPAPASATIAS